MPRGLAGALIALALVLTGCGGPGSDRAAPSPSSSLSSSQQSSARCVRPGSPELPATVSDLAGRRFVATTYDDCGTQHRLADHTRFTLTFTANTSGRRRPAFSFSTGCNGGGGGFTIRDGRFEASRMVTTTMGCLGPRGRQEHVLTHLLQSSPEITWRARRLVLRSGRISIVFRQVDGQTVPKGFETPE